jgi:serine/threonine-protein kinase HipA
MRLEPVTRLSVFYEPVEGQRVCVGKLGTRRGLVFFEWDATFIARGLELSPFKLPLRPGVVTGSLDLFDGLPGLFDDSLPDGWGRLLMERRARELGLRPGSFGPLDRLALVGSRGMGALAYEPEYELKRPTVLSLRDLEADVSKVLRDVRGADLDALIALGGSPQGARPKILAQLSEDGAVLTGAAKSRRGFAHVLIKFRAVGDEAWSAALEHAYMRMAAAAGIEVPRTRLLGRSAKHPGVFAVDRFDRQGRRHLHLHTFAGLVHARHDVPSSSYTQLLLVTRQLTGNEQAVDEQFRRACFNVFAHNRDDHTKNFAFLMDEHGVWRPSPAYDLTYSNGPGGEHATIVGREGRNPGTKDLLEVAAATGVRRPKPIVDEVRAAVNRFAEFADEAGLPKAVTTRIAKTVRTVGRRPAPRH